jgi:NAD(P) transhydrogenase subunit beta
MQTHLLEIIYLIGSITFILGLKMLSHPDSARKGNLVAAAGMILAIVGTIFFYEDADHNKLGNYIWIFGGLIIGTVAGFFAAKKVQMTAMPEMVSLFNGMGGACAAIISIVELRHFFHHYNETEILGSSYPLLRGDIMTMVLGLIIGSVSFAGSMIAWGKLNGKVKDFAFPAQHIINIVLMIGVFALGGVLMFSGITAAYTWMYLILFVALVYGVLFVLPIGGADMPVVISLLNSFTGVAAACGGFLYHNSVMLTGGILVGSAGTILTILMCKAMNRSLLNVIIGSFGGSATGSAVAGAAGDIREITMNDTAVLLSYSKKVIIVPGYGLAVAQAQHVCHELEKALEEKGVEVKYAIHPVAGRMPGHMNVLLAEADVPYPKLVEMEEINPEFSSTDVVMVIGANDVVNPAAKRDTSSPIYGMPVLDVENATTTIVMKRGMAKGYAGIENELFFEPKTRMLFGDAKATLQKLVAEVKAV